jgi:cell division protein ZapE
MSGERLVAGLVPPPRFGAARFGTYVPDPEQPSQAEAVRALTAFAAQVGGRARAPRPRRRLLRPRAGAHAGPYGIYLDGGYGVGKTHLLAALWHCADVPQQQKAFCTFVELTHLTGALGFQQAVRVLGGHRLLCIDEFELDDPGDTVLVSTLLARLAEAGVALAATSNTLPGRLGEGRFAAADFLREIQGLARGFRTLRIDGDDYRHRGLPPAPQPLPEAEAVRTAQAVPGASLDAFPQLLRHLAGIHPSRYGALVDGVTAVCLTGVEPVADQAAALRLVVLADRLHDRGVPVVASGADLGTLFGEELLRGGYRKKYGRALSRLTALAHDGRRLVRETGRRTAGTGHEEGGSAWPAA